MQYLFMRVLLRRIRAIPSFLKDRSVALRKKILIVVGTIYMLSPIDLVPEPVLLFGIIDDIVLWSFIIFYLRDELDRYWLGEKEIKPEERFRGKKIIDDVNFEVKDKNSEKTEDEDDKENEG